MVRTRCLKPEWRERDARERVVLDTVWPVSSVRPHLIEARASKRTRGGDARWSSLVARRAHNPKVVGSNPTRATEEPRRKLGFLLLLGRSLVESAAGRGGNGVPTCSAANVSAAFTYLSVVAGDA